MNENRETDRIASNGPGGHAKPRIKRFPPNYLDALDRIKADAKEESSIWRKIFKLLLWAVFSLWIRGSIALVLILGTVYVHIIISGRDAEAAQIIYACFVGLATLAGLSFASARSISGSVESTDRFAYGGERFFHAALMTLVASILKFSEMSLLKGEYVLHHGWIRSLVLLPSEVIIFGLLFFALMTGHTGLRIVNELLWTRMTRYPDWD